jgi:hypothetical protein
MCHRRIHLGDQYNPFVRGSGMGLLIALADQAGDIGPIDDRRFPSKAQRTAASQLQKMAGLRRMVRTNGSLNSKLNAVCKIEANRGQ